MGKLEGKVAFITGAARGQGRSHAVRRAQEGADIIAIDICAQIATVSYDMATPEDLAQTVKEVEAEGRRIVARQADVRDVDALRAAFDDGVAELGPVGIVLANAGIGVGGPKTSDQDWHDVIAVNLTGVWNTGRIAIPSMIEAGAGGAIVLTSSTAGLLGVGTNETGMLGYTAAKTGVVGLMRSWANFLAPHNIRVTCIAPTAVRTPMAQNLSIADLFKVNPALASAMQNAMPVDMVEAIDISNAVLWLVSDDARYVTGTVIPVDAGQLNRR
ncbi:MAG: mycofactocin-coupled SDR family oxidoreductase [Acidimicrobiales bacterium]